MNEKYDRMSPSRYHRTDQNRMRRSDQLQQTLSARSFLSENSTSTSNNESRRGRPRITASPSAGASAGANTSATSAVQVIHRKSPSLPELLLIYAQDRRSQIRRAQRTYRLKKETAIQDLRTRVADLENALHTVSSLSDDLHDAVTNAELALHPSHRTLLDQIRTAVRDQGISSEGGSGRRRRSPAVQPERDLVGVFGYQVSHSGPSTNPSTIYTYSYQESTFARRLHRFCLEQTYSWLMDPSSPPAWITHVFGLLPCLPDMDSVRRNYRRVLHAGVGESFEVRVLPFYPIGGAGMHYPRKDADGQPVYPENTREPNRILGRAVNAMYGTDMSGIGEQRQKERQLQMLDLEGEWFDCHDVQGYLEHLGIGLGYASSAVEHAPTVQLMFSELMEEPETSTLDVDRFLTCKSETNKSNIRYSQLLTPSVLVRNTRILGRAPGFKRSDVDAALREALQFT